MRITDLASSMQDIFLGWSPPAGRQHVQRSCECWRKGWRCCQSEDVDPHAAGRRPRWRWWWLAMRRRWQGRWKTNWPDDLGAARHAETADGIMVTDLDDIANINHPLCPSGGIPQAVLDEHCSDRQIFHFLEAGSAGRTATAAAGCRLFAQYDQ